MYQIRSVSYVSVLVLKDRDSPYTGTIPVGAQFVYFRILVQST